MNSQHYEDIIMKTVHEYFGEAILPFLGIHEPIIDIGPTEIPILNLTQIYMDFTFLTGNGTYLHFEFQTTDGGTRDLARFHSYEAWLHYNTGKPVITYVIFTGELVKPVYEETYGINTYRTIPISMQDKDADILLDTLKENRKLQKPLSQTDLVGLALTPVMGSKKSRSQRIFEAVTLIRNEKNEDAQRVLAVLYAFAEKFMKDPKELEKLKEVMRMTRLGQMLFDEGLEQGLEQGRESGIEDGLNLINQLNNLLLRDDRIEDLKKAASDIAYQKQLIREYHLDDRI